MKNQPLPKSPTQTFFRRFFLNSPAVAGLIFILAAAFIALFGYWIVPDDTRHANLQIPAIALKNPGFSTPLLLVKTTNLEHPESIWSVWLNGRTPVYRMIPMVDSAIALSGDSIYYNSFNGLAALSLTTIALSDAGTPAIEWRYFPLGTDKFGRCIYSRLLLGFRISLLIGLAAVAISLIAGTIIGALGGYYGGRIDDLILLLINTAWSIPTLLLVFAIVLALGRGTAVIFAAVGLTMWVDVARVVRGQVLALRNLPFIEAAQSIGTSGPRILAKHILPNLVGPLLVVASGNFATAILIESGLSYLGLGVNPPIPSWGAMLNENYGYALAGKPLPALIPAVAIALSVLAFNLVGNGLRDAVDVKS